MHTTVFALDSAVVEVQEMISSHGSLLTNASNKAFIYVPVNSYGHGGTVIKYVLTLQYYTLYRKTSTGWM